MQISFFWRIDGPDIDLNAVIPGSRRRQLCPECFDSYWGHGIFQLQNGGLFVFLADGNILLQRRHKPLTPLCAIIRTDLLFILMVSIESPCGILYYFCTKRSTYNLASPCMMWKAAEFPSHMLGTGFLNGKGKRIFSDRLPCDILVPSISRSDRNSWVDEQTGGYKC